MKRPLTILLIGMFLFAYSEIPALARAGGGRMGGSSFSYGSRGTRTYSAPARPVAPSPGLGQTQGASPVAPSPGLGQTQGASPVQPQPYNPPMQQGAYGGGGFMRSLAGGLIGGFIGSMLFRGLGYGAMGYGGGGLFGGIGIFDIILIGIGIFLLLRFLRPRREEQASQYRTGTYDSEPYRPQYSAPEAYTPSSQPVRDELGVGLADIRRLDPAFDEARIKETATDIFFKVQSAWMNREMSSVRDILAPEIYALLTEDVSRLRREGRINRLENIAMRDTVITEAWQEEGRDYITVKILANVLDYTTDESGKVVEGSKTEPVKFTEFWTFVRTIGRGGWQLTAIQQDEG